MITIRWQDLSDIACVLRSEVLMQAPEKIKKEAEKKEYGFKNKR